MFKKILLLLVLLINFSSLPVYCSIEDARLQEAIPYLLPLDHPLKKKLDKIFSKARVISSVETLKKAGFKHLPLRKWGNVTVASHPKLKGYKFKLFFDNQIGIDEQEAFTRRIRGANLIRDLVEEKNYQKYFKVPNKWLYLLPENPAAEEGTQRKNFILVVEDMHLVSSYNNWKLWKHGLSKNRLTAVHDVLQTLGLIDSVYITNIPFATDGKIAFIDTEHFLQWPVPFLKLGRFLNEERQQDLNELL